MITLGRQTCDFSARILHHMLTADHTATQAVPIDNDDHTDQDVFFRALGFQVVHSLDVSCYEGASILFDLNRGAALLPPSLVGSYDLVLNGGTLEHCFDIANSLAAALTLVAADGLLVSISPMNNYVDHGFYQFSPTLFFDYANANRWSVVESAMIRLTLDGGRPSCSDIYPLSPGRLGTVGMLDGAAYLHYVVLQRNASSVTMKVPLQRYYEIVHAGEKTSSDYFQACAFEPYRIA